MFVWVFLPLKISLLFSGNKTQGQFPGTQKHQNNTSQTQVKELNYDQKIALKPLEHILHLKIAIQRN